MSRFFGTACAALALSAGAAFGGFSNGDIVFTDAPDDAIRVIRAGSNLLETLYVADPMDGPGIRFGDITRVDGRFYVNSGVPDADAGIPGRLIRIDSLFGASPMAADLATGGFLQNPIGIAFNRRSDQFLSINNTGQTPMQMAPDFDGIIGVSRADGTQTFRFDEVAGLPGLNYQAGNSIAQRADRANAYLVTSINGGFISDNPGVGDDVETSIVYNVRVNASGDVSLNPFFDFKDTPFGDLTFVRGVTTAIGDDDTLDVYVTDRSTDAIYRIDTDADGNATGLSLILDGLMNPGKIVYDRFTDTLVFGEIENDSISRVNLDGTGLTVLATGVDPRGFYIVPAPGAAALLGLGGLAAIRRRR